MARRIQERVGGPYSGRAPYVGVNEQVGQAKIAPNVVFEDPFWKLFGNPLGGTFGSFSEALWGLLGASEF